MIHQNGKNGKKDQNFKTIALSGSDEVVPNSPIQPKWTKKEDPNSIASNEQMVLLLNYSYEVQ